MCLCLPNHLYEIESLRFTYFAKILFKFDANIHAVQFTPIFWAAKCINTLVWKFIEKRKSYQHNIPYNYIIHADLT